MPLDGSIGAFEIGVTVSTFLFGISTAQTYLYYHLFPHDSKRLKCLVAAVWIIDLGHTMGALHALYFYTVMMFGVFEVPKMKVPLSLALSPITSETVFVIVRSYNIMRIHQCFRRWCMTSIFFVLLFARSAGTFVVTVGAIKMTSLPKFTEEWGWGLYLIFSIGAVLDMAIPCALVYYLASKRSSMQDATLAIVDKLILWAIETGLMTGLLSLLVVIFFRTLPKTFAWMAVYMSLAKMFSNSLLANLNSRIKLRAMQEETIDLSFAVADNQTTPSCFPHRLGAIIQVSSHHTKTVDDVQLSRIIFRTDSLQRSIPSEQLERDITDRRPTDTINSKDSRPSIDNSRQRRD